ncbi:hypothetical protein EON65_55330, partial [archaeon]
MLVLGACLGVLAAGWNEGLQCGLWCFYTNVLFLMIGYICLALCMAEMTSALPFPGGNYGFVRVALGPLCGYLVGCFEMMQNQLFVMSCVVKFSTVISDELVLPKYADIGIWAAVLLVGSFLVTMHSAVRTSLGMVLAVFNVVIIFMYYLASMLHDDYSEHDENMAASGLARKSSHFLVASWFFMALNIVPFIASLSPTAKTSMSRSVLVFTVQLCAMALTICFAALSLGPDSEQIARLSAPLAVGLERLLATSPLGRSGLLAGKVGAVAVLVLV